MRNALNSDKNGGYSFANYLHIHHILIRWIKSEDYLSADNLFYAVNNYLNQVGDKININFKQYY